MRRWYPTSILLLALGCTAESDPSGPPGATLWASTPVIAAGATSVQLRIALQREATVSYAAYPAAQSGIAAADVRAEAELGSAGPSAAAGTVTIGGGRVGDTVVVTIDALASGQNYHVYLAAEPTQADPPPTDLDAVHDLTASLVAVQPALSYTSTAIAATTIGYYAYLPEDHYYNPNEKFPLLIFLHGSGEKGNGTSDLNKILIHGPPKLVKNGRAFPFIIISPQLPASQGGWPVNLVDELIARAKAAYRVDTTRIYVTGLSMGGYGAWAYAVTRPTVVAAVVPIAGAGSTGQACVMKNVPTWAFHGDADNTVNQSGSINMVNAINACSPAPSVAAKLTIYPGVGHDSWTRTYDGSAGHDIYSWLLQYHR